VQLGPNFGEVMVVVFGDEVKVVDETERLFEARMEQGATEEWSIQSVEPLRQSGPRRAKFR